jgi:hypothetical protein
MSGSKEQDMIMGSHEWALEEFGRADLGDSRRVSRLLRLAAGFADRPAGAVTEAFCTTAERRGVYRFLDNEDVHAEVVASAA